MLVLLTLSLGTDRDGWEDALRSDFAPSPQTRLTNTQSIALASGIPRETVRRKLEAMRTGGWIVRDEAGNWTPTPRAATDLRESSRETIGFLRAVVAAALSAAKTGACDVQLRSGTAALHPRERLPDRQHGGERLGPRRTPGERALGFRTSGPRRGRLQPDEAAGVLPRSRRASDPRHRYEDRGPEPRGLADPRTDARRNLPDRPGARRRHTSARRAGSGHARGSATRRRALHLHAEAAGRSGPLFRGRVRAADEPELRDGHPRRLGGGGLQLRERDVVADAQLPALVLLRRRSRHGDLRALGSAALGRHGRAMGAGREPVQGRPRYERDRPSDPGPPAGRPEGRARAPALGLLRRQRDERRREPGAELPRRQRVRLRGERHGQMVRTAATSTCTGTSPIRFPATRSRRRSATTRRTGSAPCSSSATHSDQGDDNEQTRSAERDWRRSGGGGRSGGSRRRA